MQFVSTQIRGREAGVIKIAYTVNVQENTAVAEGKVAKEDTHLIVSLGKVSTECTVGVLSLQYWN